MGGRSGRRLVAHLVIAAFVVAGCSVGAPSSPPGTAADGVPSAPATTADVPTTTTPVDGEGDDATEEGPSPSPEGSSSGEEGAAAVTPTITSAELVDDGLAVSAGVSGVVEEGGTCRLTVSGADGTEVSVSVGAFADATSTLCEPLAVAADQLGARPWTVLVAYTSDAHAGSSSPVEVS